MQALEKRTSQRTAFQQPMIFELSATHPSEDSSERKARGIDISSTGIGLETKEELKKSEIVKLFVPLGKEGANIPVFAEVRWVVAFEGNYRQGLHFLS